MPAVRRRTPLRDRIASYISDNFLWLSEEINSNDWDEIAEEWSTSIGVILNLIFIIAKANSGRWKSYGEDDVFSQSSRMGSGWLTWIVSCLQITHLPFHLV
jgi:hypothetical protein